MKILIKKHILPLLLSAVLILGLFCSCSVRISTTEKPQTQSVSNTVRVTFPEGFTAAETAKRLEENGVCSADEFLTAINDPAYLEGFDFVIDNPGDRSFLLEGYLFPDTYDFYIGENTGSVIKKFLRNTESKLTPEMKSRCIELGYSVDEILRIASVIQEEAGNPAEMKKVSSVLHNRLNSSSFPKLQCDCTIFYLRDNVASYVTEERLEELKELYSTYKCDGLPAGPITNSGIDAVMAALYPENTDYYFFVTDPDNNYYYAETWSEHKENCALCGIETN